MQFSNFRNQENKIFTNFLLYLSAPNCCYYFHCPTFDFLVVPDSSNGRKNAQDYMKSLANKNQSSAMNMVLFVTFPNLQRPGGIMKHLNKLNKGM